MSKPPDVPESRGSAKRPDSPDPRNSAGRTALMPLLTSFIIMTAFGAAVALIPAVCETLIPSLPKRCAAAAVRVVFVLVLVFTRRRRDANDVFPTRRRQHIASLALCALCGVLLQLSLASALTLICGSESIGVTAMPSDIASIAALLSAVIITPVCEEAVFRGAAYRAARLSVGTVPAVLLTSLAFALIHQGAAAMISAFICALILAALTERHNSILGALILHSAFNLTSFFAGYIPLSPAVCAAIFIPLTAACIIFTLRKGTNQ